MDNWWQGAVGYQIYVRSFADSDGDGIGDLPGIRERLPYLADLGVDLIWLTPFYPSPQADHGYDVADYLDVDPTYGTLSDLDRLVSDAHDLGLRVVCDLVPNHTSDRHPWFIEARASRRSPRRDWYVWRDPAPDGGPPNNWVSHFGGPAWTFDDDTGQYYMHLFLPEQPDLNWANEAVRAAFDDILRFWFERGIDGFRIDVAHSLLEDPQFRDNPLKGDPPLPGATPSEVFDAYDQVHNHNLPGVVEIYQRWNRVAAKYDALLVGEVYLLEPTALTRYVTDNALHNTFVFSALRVGWDGPAIRDTLRRAVDAVGSAGSWPLSSHDDPRAATRFGGGPRGARRSLAYLTLLCGLPGIPFLLQGDELGLDNGELDVAEDPIAVRNVGAAGRDGSRTPMPWAPGPHLGFTSGTPWLPLGRNRTDADTVAVQTDDPGSFLQRTRRLLACRRDLPDLTGNAPCVWLDTPDEVVALQRGDTVVALNAAGTMESLTVGTGARLAYGTDDAARVEDGILVLPPDSAAYVRVST